MKHCRNSTRLTRYSETGSVLARKRLSAFFATWNIAPPVAVGFGDCQRSKATGWCASDRSRLLSCLFIASVTNWSSVLWTRPYTSTTAQNHRLIAMAGRAGIRFTFFRSRLKSTSLITRLVAPLSKLLTGTCVPQAIRTQRRAPALLRAGFVSAVSAIAFASNSTAMKLTLTGRSSRKTRRSSRLIAFAGTRTPETTCISCKPSGGLNGAAAYATGYANKTFATGRRS
jgi:hypothetical protein